MDEPADVDLELLDELAAVLGTAPPSRASANSAAAHALDNALAVVDTVLVSEEDMNDPALLAELYAVTGGAPPPSPAEEKLGQNTRPAQPLPSAAAASTAATTTAAASSSGRAELESEIAAARRRAIQAKGSGPGLLAANIGQGRRGSDDPSRLKRPRLHIVRSGYRASSAPA